MTGRLLVLGHTGFIGSHVLKRFQDQAPEVDLVGLSTESLDLTAAGADEALGAYLDRDTTVVMCAAIVRHAGDHADSYLTNVKMAVALGKAIRLQPVRQVVLVSSAAVYGEDVAHACITEATAPHPTSYYGMAKFTTEWLLQKAAGEGTALLVLRPPTVYGPGERVMAYGPRSFIAAALDAQPIVLWGDGLEQREFVFVDDLVDVVQRMVTTRSSGIVNVVSGVSYTFLDVLDGVAKVAGVRPVVTRRPRTKQKVDHHFSSERLRRDLPGIRFTTLDEGLRRTYEAERQGRSANV